MCNKKTRVGALILVLIMVMTFAFTGCGDKKNAVATKDNLNPLGQMPFSKDKVTLEIMMPSSGNVEDYETNKYTLELEKAGNVDIKFNLLSPADSDTVINLKLSSGQDLPDIINTPLKDDVVATYGPAGMFVVLNDYYANSSYYLKPQLEAYQQETGVDLLKYITMSDGNIYGIIKYNESLQNEVPNPLWINKAWLAKAGMEVPTTLDEFTAALTYFKNHDMNGNGKMDEIPMVDCAEGGLLNIIENAFVKTGVDDITIKADGTLDMAYATEGYKEFLKYANSLYSAGLIDPVTFSQDNATLRTLLNGEETRVGVFTNTSTSILTAGSARRENHEYAPMFLDNPAKPGYSTFKYMQTMPSQAMFITKDCEYPETAFRIADYMCSEKMTVWSRWGEEGTDWIRLDESTPGMYDFIGAPAYLEPVLQWGSKQNAHWYNGTPGFRRANVALGMSSTDTSQQSKAFAIEELHKRYSDPNWSKDDPNTKLFYEKAIPERVYKLIYTEDELLERSDIINAIDPYVKQMRYDFITGKTNIDTGWDSYIKELKGMNVDRLAEINNAAYNRMK
ncbi:MAG: extracellular solute-binding protein [Clostridia bacterium]|nr:extracellular solute-binding protein [Clostridia bacterium]